MEAQFDILQAIASLSGKTSYEVWESGNDWKTIVQNTEALLGKQKKWNVIQDEVGNVIQIVGKNGKYVDFTSAVGASENYVAANQLVTDLVVEESGSLTAYTGNIVNEVGEVTKKGLSLGASTGAKVAMGALGAFGAVATGVNWYKDNPQFWTDLSAKLLPFGYADPTDKSWGDIFYEALVPTAVDDEGKTYVQADLLQAIADYTNQQGIYASATEAQVNNTSTLQHYTQSVGWKAYDEFPTQYNNFKGTISKGTLIIDIKPVNQGYRFEYQPLTGNSYIGALKESKYGTRGYIGFIGEGSCQETLYYKNSLDFSRVLSTSGDSDIYPSQFRLQNDESKIVSVWSENVRDGIVNAPVNELSGFSAKAALQASSIFAAMLLGTITAASSIDNVTPVPSATYPDGRALNEVYPDWYKNAVTSVNPNFKPSEPESGDNPKYITWLPLQFPDNVTGDGGSTQPDVAPEQVQQGQPTPNDTTEPTTNDAIADGVLPDPYPDPETEPSSGNTPSAPTPTPDTPDPDPNLPFISGGNANALWRIYNPSTAVLQQFGAWLWSSDPIKMIREIFSNNPADGIIGLHMIYVTPPVGGTSNIVVGYVDSGVASNYVSQQYVDIDCGSVTIPLRYQSALDYGYTKVLCYLPFIGIVPLDSYDIIGKTVHIKYTVDVLTGTVLAQISVSGDGFSAVLYTFNGSCSVEYPLTAGTRSNQMLSLITGAVGGAAIGGVGGAILGGLRGAATGADVRASGNLAGNAGAMGIRKPYIIVKRPVEVAANRYNTFYGYPANITGRLSTFSGYTRVKDVHVDDISGASAEEKTEIENLLKSGVIIN